MKKKTMLILFVLLICNGFLLFGEPVQIAPTSGLGTEEDPYLIENINNLYWLTQNSGEWDKHYLQTADIILTDCIDWDGRKGFTPIGNVTTSFTGVYDGRGYEIQNIVIDRSMSDNQGFFGYISGAELKNICLTNAVITGNHNVGGIAGHAINSLITACHSNGFISAAESAGFIAGYINTSSIISNCYTGGIINSLSTAGGIAGKADASEIVKCYSLAASIPGAPDERGEILNGGAICGEVLNGTTVENCFWDTEVSDFITGIGNGGSIPNSGKLTAEMKDIATFTDTATEGLDEAWDFTGTPNNDSGTDDIWIIRSSVNDGYPYFNSAPVVNPQTFNISEDAENGDLVGQVVVNEPDNQDVSFSITSGNTNSVFAIDGSGNITVNNETEIDYEITSAYELNITVTETSAKGEKFQYSVGEITVNIDDVNEPPIFSQESYTGDSINEYAHGNDTNPEIGTVVCTLTVQEIERQVLKEALYQNVFFEIISGNINNAFRIVLPIKGTESEHTAYVAINNKYALDYETIPNHQFVLTVKAYDDGVPSAYSTAEVTITLNPVDEAPTLDDLYDTNIPGLVPPGHNGSSPVTIMYENETFTYYFYGYDPEGQPIYLTWFKNGEFLGSENTFTFIPQPLKKGEKSREYTMIFTASDQSKADPLIHEWKIVVLNADNPITVNSLTPAPNTSTDPSISTAGGSYNMTEGETLNFSVDADDPDGSLLWRNWYVNDELVWLDPDFDFNTHFMSSGGSPYDIKLYLQGQQGDYQEFHWTVNVSNKEAVTYSNSPMVLSGTAMIEGLNAESGDAVAAYSGDELRGETLLNGSNFDNFAINLSENNEEISFVIYDSDNNIIKTVHRTLNGEINTVQDITLHGYEEVSNSFVLAENWNYVSFNTIPEDNSVSSVFTNMNVSQIQTVDEVYSSSNPEFLNTLKEIKPGVGYLVKMNSNSSMFVNGYSAENSEIELHEGWILIGYTERSSADIETAFGSIMDKIIEIKSEIGVFSADMPAYMNTLSYIEKNKAYWVKCSNDCVLDFPSIEDKRHNSSYLEIQDFNKVTSCFSAEGNGLRDTYSTSPTRPPVNVSFGNIAVRTNSFVIYAEISNPSDNTLCAYSNNELRGISQIIENSNKYYTSIVINSDISGEEITLKIGDKTIKTISSIPGTTIGKDNLLHLDGSLENNIPSSFKVTLFPNPFNPEINISFELPKTERFNISVFDINGKLVKTLEDNVFNSGKHSITWNGTDSNNNKMASGIYFVKVKSDSNNTTEKIVMMK